MRFHRVISKAIMFTLLSFAATVHARTNNLDYIVCPKISSIHQAAALINQAELEGGAYIVSTDANNPAIYENGLYWMIMGQVLASSKEEAISKAQKLASEVGIKYSEIATRSTLGFCGYFIASTDNSESRTIGIMAISVGDKPQITPNSLFLTKL